MSPGWVDDAPLVVLDVGVDVVLDAVVLVVVERAGLLVLDVLDVLDEVLLVLGLDDVLGLDVVRG